MAADFTNFTNSLPRLNHLVGDFGYDALDQSLGGLQMFTAILPGIYKQSEPKWKERI
jgi:hypothetical protein